MTPPELHREHALILLKKAEQDERLLNAVLEDSRISDEVFGFHCQQAAEKLIKSALAARGIAYRKMHDIEAS